MRIGVVGRLDRVPPELNAVARSEGHELESHTGVLASQAARTSLRALIGRSHLVFVLAGVDNGDTVRFARRAARAHHRPLRIMRRLASEHIQAYRHAVVPDGPPASATR
jgi:hypothetical protein